MSREERAARAAEQAKKGTPNDALMQCVATLCPKRFASYQKTGQWGDLEDRSTRAPYLITEQDNGNRLVQIESEGGDVIGGIGATVPDAIAALARKVLS